MRLVRSLFLCVFAILMASPALALDVEIKVSSFRVDLELDYGPENLLDGNVESAWIGGGIGPGAGQWIELVFDFPVRVERLGIFNGHQAKDQFDKFRRIRSGQIVYPDGVEVAFWLRDEPGEQIIKCGGKPTKSLRIVIDQVFPKGETFASVKVAVSELKLYTSLGARSDGAKSDQPDEMHIPAPPPVSPDKIVSGDIVDLLRLFYVKQTSLADDYETLFAKDVRERNGFRFEIFKEVQRQRGTYKILRTAKVDTSGLGFELVRSEGGWAEIRVFGSYRVKVADLDQNLEEDSTFILSKEADGWKIVELEGEEELF